MTSTPYVLLVDSFAYVRMIVWPDSRMRSFSSATAAGSSPVVAM
jgi:hypothetical protein